jgi:16S rRNA (adenine1518-N6/adenine1519-N6)-dimethyltransferase
MEIKKSLGQNFFINEHLGEKIVEIILAEKPKNIVEIGPGEGFFTGKIQKNSPDTRIVCIEKDNLLARRLSELNKSITVYNEDFLNFDMSKLPEDIIFFGSLPYNVSKPIIKKIISSQYFIRSAFFIIQKEVADKYTAKEPDNNILSLTAQLYSIPQKLINIENSSFRPKPKVKSTFIKFSPKEKSNIPEGFEDFLKKCFRTPRKTLKNNLNTNSSSALLSKRPSELSLNEYLFLFSQNLI